MRKIRFSTWGIHFETNAGQINAHWKDLFGIGLSNTIKYHFFLSIKRFWKQVGIGIIFLVTKRHR